MTEDLRQMEWAASLAEAVEHLTHSRPVLGYPEGKRWVRKSEVLDLIRAWSGRPYVPFVPERPAKRVSKRCAFEGCGRWAMVLFDYCVKHSAMER